MYHTVSTSNPVPKIIKNGNVDGNVTLAKLNYKRTVYVFTWYLISHTFSTNCVPFISCLKKTEETNNLQYKYTFLQSGPHMKNLKVLIKLYQKET